MEVLRYIAENAATYRLDAEKWSAFSTEIWRNVWKERSLAATVTVELLDRIRQELAGAAEPPSTTDPKQSELRVQWAGEG